MVLLSILDNELLKLSQHDILPGRSCVINLPNFLENVSLLRLMIILCHCAEDTYLDFQKSVNIIIKFPMSRVMTRLHRLGIRVGVLMGYVPQAAGLAM